MAPTSFQVQRSTFNVQRSTSKFKVNLRVMLMLWLQPKLVRTYSKLTRRRECSFACSFAVRLCVSLSLRQASGCDVIRTCEHVCRCVLFLFPLLIQISLRRACTANSRFSCKERLGTFINARCRQPKRPWRLPKAADFAGAARPRPIAPAAALATAAVALRAGPQPPPACVPSPQTRAPTPL